jgi:hypothetical protein
MSETRSIYGLSDPRNGVLRYVGQTRSIYSRLHYHLHGGLRARRGMPTPNELWISELKSAGLTPEIFTIETVDAAEAREAEAFWIGYFSAIGATLTNVTRAQKNLLIGIAVRAVRSTPSSRAKSSASARTRWAAPGARERHSERIRQCRTKPKARGLTVSVLSDRAGGRHLEGDSK